MSSACQVKLCAPITASDIQQSIYSSLVSSCSGAVLSLTMSEDGESCYSGGLDGTVRCWKMPDLNVDPYDNYGKSLTWEHSRISTQS